MKKNRRNKLTIHERDSARSVPRGNLIETGAHEVPHSREFKRCYERNCHLPC
jgi:hypothetical protein